MLSSLFQPSAAFPTCCLLSLVFQNAVKGSNLVVAVKRVSVVAWSTVECLFICIFLQADAYKTFSLRPNPCVYLSPLSLSKTSIYTHLLNRDLLSGNRKKALLCLVTGTTKCPLLSLPPISREHRWFLKGDSALGLHSIQEKNSNSDICTIIMRNQYKKKFKVGV